MMYETELMMALVIASTALMGLVGVLVGQFALRADTAPMRGWLKAFLIASLLLGLFTTAMATFWFATPGILGRNGALVSFQLQIITFLGAVGFLWYEIW
jgi:hypothetical protein